jgi:GntR family transcriptional regulator / MocR family aminotransferase
MTALARERYADRLEEVVKRASEMGVEVRDLSRTAAGASGMCGMMLGYGAIPTTKISEGLRLLRLSFRWAATSP